MTGEKDRGAPERRGRLRPGRIPDPLRAHGAWIYLVASSLAGMGISTTRGFAPAFFVAAGFVGLFVLTGSAAARGRRSSLGRLAIGLSLAIGALALAVTWGAEPAFLVVGSTAAVPAAIAAVRAGARGFLSPGALSFGVVTLVVAAPATAVAGGASWRSALLLLALLAPVFFWRTWRLARALGKEWTRERLARRGLLESAVAILWAAVAVLLTRLAA